MNDPQTAARGKTKEYIKPEWIRVPDAVRISGLSRSTIYELIASDAIKSFSNRQRGAQRGARLINYDSLLDYLDSAYAAAAATSTPSASSK